MRAIGINPTDWKHALGEWGKPGNVSGCDSAGDIVRIGSEVKHLQVGDRIAAFNTYVVGLGILPLCFWAERDGVTRRGGTQPNNGAFAEYTTFDSALAFKIPEGMTYEEAASFPVRYLCSAATSHLIALLTWIDPSLHCLPSPPPPPEPPLPIVLSNPIIVQRQSANYSYMGRLDCCRPPCRPTRPPCRRARLRHRLS